ncbi:ASN_HP2_G0016000.mRNA.1.CDS.1 [Saccharomyces cerevisiae]|nr:ASN_HP2_G0016000.mRNA.1.CDS.1 [Saccharomyces cerevisiae]CAI6561151.1 ASN_HP2_G0016000.mRNA.1.CDS.1 [Saccharomyces cerevisiae]
MSYSFLDFGSDEIKHLFLYGIDVYFAQGVFNTRIMQGLSKMFRALCLLGWPESIVSEDGLGSIDLWRECCESDEEYKEYLEDIEPYQGDPVGYLKFLA